MKTSLHGICAIISHEAVVLSTYDDGVQVLTIGVGHTANAGAPKPRKGMKISLTEAINIFRRDLNRFEDDVNDAVHVPLSQHQFDAVVSWHFNTGAVRTATLTKKLNEGNYVAAGKEFAKWKKAGGKVLQGLVNRRKLETAIFMQGDYGDKTILVYQHKGGKVQSINPIEIQKLLGSDAEPEENMTTEELLKNPSSGLLPTYRPRQNAKISTAALEKFESLVPEGRQGDPVKILAVRGYYTDSMGKKSVNDRGLYDDAIIVVEPNGTHNFNGNTDPGRYKAGIANLKSPQAVRYKPGPHGFKRKNGPYPAFRQNSDCTVVRDKTGDDTGMFYINLHRGGKNTTSSAGCQTIPPHQWNEFKALVDSLLDKYGQQTFYYVLIDVVDVPTQDEIFIQQPEPNQIPKQQEPDMSNKDGLELVDILKTAIALAERIRKLREGGAPDIISNSSNTGDVLQTLLVLLAGKGNSVNSISSLLENGESKSTTTSGPKETKLTPVNNALGTTIGGMLDGRKTGLGIIGMLATTVLPLLFPQLIPVAAVAKTVLSSGGTEVVTSGETAMGVASQVFTALAGWGVLGKVEKWVKEVRK